MTNVEIKIGNILAGLLFIICLGVFVKMKPEIMDALIAISKTGPGNPPADQLKGVIAIGLIILGLISAIRLIISERQK